MTWRSRWTRHARQRGRQQARTSAASATADTARSTRGGTAPEPTVFLGGIGAGSERTRLVVRDLRAGTERSWPLDPALRLSQIAWSPDGGLLAYELNGEATGARHQLRVVPVASMRTVGDGLALRAPDSFTASW
jgi:hypothetical protein